MYTALYRKLRPQSFADVVDQVHIVQTLKNQIVGGRVGHAYLFCGVRGTGKTSCAKIFARAINCVNAQDGEACGACVSCVDISLARSMDIIEIDAASNNGVDHVRSLIEEVRYPPQGKHKVYIIDEVHMFSNSSFNALLKTLEEPPPQVIFILATTDPHKIPATIHSRVMRFDFHRISVAGMRDALSLLDCLAGLYFGQQITLDNALEVTGSMSRDVFEDMFNAVKNKDATGALTIIEDISSKGRDFAQFTEEFLSFLRDEMIEQAKTNPQGLHAITGMVSHFSGALRNIKQSGRLALEIACIEQIYAGTQPAQPAQFVAQPVAMQVAPKPTQQPKPAQSQQTQVHPDPQPEPEPQQPPTQNSGIEEIIANWSNFSLKKPALLMGTKAATLDDNTLYIIHADGNIIAKGNLEKKKDELKQELNCNFEIEIKSNAEFHALHEQKHGKNPELARLQEKINHEITVTY